MLDDAKLKIYVWSGPIRLVGHFDSPMDAARSLMRRIMDSELVHRMDNVIEVSFMGFDKSLMRFDPGQVLLTMQLGTDRDD